MVFTNDTERVRIDSNGIEVKDGYIKLATSSGVPPDSDCDNPDQVGRMKIDSSNAILYLCTALGWRNLSISELYLPSIHR